MQKVDTCGAAKSSLRRDLIFWWVMNPIWSLVSAKMYITPTVAPTVVGVYSWLARVLSIKPVDFKFVIFTHYGSNLTYSGIQVKSMQMLTVP